MATYSSTLAWNIRVFSRQDYFMDREPSSWTRRVVGYSLRGSQRVGYHWATNTTLLRGAQGFPDGSVVKNPPANAREAKDMGSIPGSGKSSGEGNGNPLQHSWKMNGMEDPLGQQATEEWKDGWRSQGVSKSWTQLNNSACTGEQILSALIKREKIDVTMWDGEC